mgnify:CR=1 FL=1
MTKGIKNHRTKFFLVLGVIGVLAVLIGFSTTFWIPVSRGTFEAPLIIYIHGAFTFSWIILFVIQSILIQTNNFRLHKRLGLLGIIIASAVIITIIPVGLYQIERELKQSLDYYPVSTIIGTITSAILFGLLVLAGILKRRDHSTHKRLMLLATLLLLWPAWFRFRHIFPAVPNPEIWFAVVLSDSFILISIIWDKITYGKFNTALLYAGLFIIAEHATEVYLFDSPMWREVANIIYELLT